MMTGGAGGDKRYGSSGDKSSQLARKTIKTSGNGRQRTEEQMKEQEAMLYADDRMVASANPWWLQSEIDTLTRLLDQVGLETSVCKTVGMVFYIYRALGVWAEKSYTRQMIGAGVTGPFRGPGWRCLYQRIFK